jgi:uncharacterized protein (UPF0335 family)
LLSPERLATYVQEQQADSIEERERLQRELDGHRVALVACDEEWTRLLELAAKGLASEYDLEMYKKKLDRRRGDLRQQIQQCEERLDSLGATLEQIRSLVAHVEKIVEERLNVMLEAIAETYSDDAPTTWDLMTRRDLMKYAVEDAHERTLQLRARWATMTPEQRQRAVNQWRKRQMREKLRAMTIEEKQQLFDAFGLKAEWTHGQPLKITLTISCTDEIRPS